MIHNVISVHLPVDEQLIIQKNRLMPDTVTGREKRISIVTGTHGDELEGQYVCYELIRRITEGIENLQGIVDVFPALNPLGMDTVNRGIPMFDLDMNRIFPGSDKGTMTEAVAAAVVDDIVGSDFCIDVHSSNIFLKEVPQIRIAKDTADRLLPYAKLMNTDFIWVFEAPTVLEATLAHSLNMVGVPTLVAEMGVGMRITRSYGDDLVEGILNLMKELGIWTGEVMCSHNPRISMDGQVHVVHAKEAGVFLPTIMHGDIVTKDQIIGRIVDSLTGSIKQTVTASEAGMVFTLREYPVVFAGSLLARIVGGASL